MGSSEPCLICVPDSFLLPQANFNSSSTVPLFLSTQLPPSTRRLGLDISFHGTFYRIHDSGKTLVALSTSVLLCVWSCIGTKTALRCIMEVSSDSQIDTDLPDSPSDASVSNIASPPDEVSALEQDLPGNILADNQNSTDFLPSQQLSMPAHLPSKQRGNGRVYEISQDGKLKLKISLKGLRTSSPAIPTADNTTTTATTEVADGETQDEDSGDNTQKLTLESGSKDNTQETAKIVSQDAVPPFSISDAASQPLPDQNTAAADTRENQSIAQRINSSRNDLDDTFSDEISLSEIEKGVVGADNAPSVVDLSPSIQITKTQESFTVRLKLSTTLIERLKHDKLSPVAKKGQNKVSKRLQAKAKAVKPRTKMKKRPKPQYSRYMVKMPQFLPVVPPLPQLPQNPPMDLAALLKMQLANQAANGAVVGSNNTDHDNNNDDDDDDIVEKSVRLSLKDPLSGSRIVTPLRSRYCSHVECFDYESFLAMYNLRPFRIAIQRFSEKPAKVGEVDVMRILEDTKRKVIDVKDHNKVTPSFPYKTKQKMFKEKNKQMNDLEWFCCPICKLEFNIKRIGDIYVVGEFVDILQDLSLEENNETVEDIEIDLSQRGKWRWIREDENNALLSQENTPAAAGHEATPDTGKDTTTNEASQVANGNMHKEKRHNVEVVTLDSEDDDDENINTGANTNANGDGDGSKESDTTKGYQQGPQSSASEAIINALGPIIQAHNSDTSEEDMMKQIDALFESEVMNADEDTPASTPSAPTQNPSPVRAVEVVPVSTPPPPALVPGVPPPPRFANNHNNSLFQKAVDNYRSYSAGISNPGGTFVKDPNPHRGVVVFRPGAFTSLNYEEPPAPVFMSGEGAADDPIVLD